MAQRPALHDTYHYRRSANLTEFQSVDGDKIFKTGWGNPFLYWGVRSLLNRVEKVLVAAPLGGRSISLEGALSGECRQRGITQVPYRKENGFVLFSIHIEQSFVDILFSS